MSQLARSFVAAAQVWVDGSVGFGLGCKGPSGVHGTRRQRGDAS